MKKGQCATFGKRLAELRTKKGITQTQLAEITQIQRVTIAKYETGERAPSIDNLLSFVEYFGVSADYLLGLTNIRSNDPDIVSVCQFTGLSDVAINCLKQEDELYRTFYSSDQFFPTINEILCNTPIYYAIYNLIKLRESGIDLLKNPEDKKSLLVEDLNEIDHRRYDYEGNQYNIACDVKRYNAIKHFEELIDEFDVRKYPDDEKRILITTIQKEVPDHGKHPSPKE